MSLTEAEQETLADLVQSPGWVLLWTKIIPTGSENAANTAFEAIRKGATTEAARYVGKFEGAVSVALDAYTAAKVPAPDFIEKLKRVS